MNAFQQLYLILNLESFHINYETAVTFLKTYCLQELRDAARINKFGFKSSGPYLLDNRGVKNEIEWLLSHFYISGLDKANNNACFLCIRHIRLQAFQWLMGEDFTPCMSSNTNLWLLPTSIFDSVKAKLLSLLPESPPVFTALPFLMALFKQHKQKYRWVTNAHNTIYTNVASLLIVATMQILESFKGWAKKNGSWISKLLRM